MTKCHGLVVWMLYVTLRVINPFINYDFLAKTVMTDTLPRINNIKNPMKRPNDSASFQMVVTYNIAIINKPSNDADPHNSAR